MEQIFVNSNTCTWLYVAYDNVLHRSVLLNEV